jgi:hypothetical protein
MIFVLLLFLAVFFCGQYMTGAFWIILAIYMALELFLLFRRK